MDMRPDHAASMRVMALGVARDLERIVAGERMLGGLSPMGLNAFFRVHSHWRSHGWYGDPSMSVVKGICERVFAGDAEDRSAFARGLRSAAGIVVEGTDEPVGTQEDRDVFWGCVAALSEETRVAMPERPAEPVEALDYVI